MGGLIKKLLVAWFLISMGLTSAAQSRAQEFAQKYEAYQQVLPKTNIYLTFNQPKYSPGDTVFFTAYFLKENRSWIQGKQLLDLNLVDTGGHSQLHFKFSVFDGAGHNQFVVPKSLPVGIYLITVHSNWMKNFDPPGIFQREIKIVGEKEVVPVFTRSEIPTGGTSQVLAQVKMPKQNDKPIEITISSQEGSRLRSEPLNILISVRGEIAHAADLTLGSDGEQIFFLSREKLPEGNAIVSILSNDGEVLGSTSFYSPGKGAITASLETFESSFQARQKVSLQLSLLDETGNPIQGEFSVKVLNRALFENTETDTFLDQLRRDSNSGIPWKKVLSNSREEPVHFYSSVIERSGIAYDAATSEPLADFTQVTFYLQKSNWRYQTFTSNGGRVSLTIPDFYEDDELFYLGMTRRKEEVNNIRVKWDEQPALPLPMAPASRETEKIDAYGSFAEKQKIINRSYGFYTSTIAADTIGHGMLELEEMLGGADNSFNVDDYSRFATMKELIKEVIKYMKQRGSGDKMRVRISLLEPPIGDPLYIIDGIATKSTAFFLSLKPSDLSSIKIIKDQFKLPKLGLFGKNGIVLVKTKNGNVREPLDDTAKQISGLSKPIGFGNITETDIQNGAVPIFRSSIYWNPSMTTDENGIALIEFFTSDDIGSYQIQIDGMAEGGKPFSVKRGLR